MTQTAMAASTAGRIRAECALWLAAGIGGAVATIYLAMASSVKPRTTCTPWCSRAHEPSGAHRSAACGTHLGTARPVHCRDVTRRSTVWRRDAERG